MGVLSFVFFLGEAYLVTCAVERLELSCGFSQDLVGDLSTSLGTGTISQLKLVAG